MFSCTTIAQLVVEVTDAVTDASNIQMQVQMPPERAEERRSVLPRTQDCELKNVTCKTVR